MQAQYASWLEQSQAVFAVSYTSMTVKEIETLRAKARDAGGELHVVKNTLIGRTIIDAGLPMIPVTPDMRSPVNVPTTSTGAASLNGTF